MKVRRIDRITVHEQVRFINSGFDKLQKKMGWNKVMDNTIRLLFGCFWLLRDLSTAHLQLYLCHARVSRQSLG